MNRVESLEESEVIVREEVYRPEGSVEYVAVDASAVRLVRHGRLGQAVGQVGNRSKLISSAIRASESGPTIPSDLFSKETRACANMAMSKELSPHERLLALEDKLRKSFYKFNFVIRYTQASISVKVDEYEILKNERNLFHSVVRIQKRPGDLPITFVCRRAGWPSSYRSILGDGKITVSNLKKQLDSNCYTIMLHPRCVLHLLRMFLEKYNLYRKLSLSDCNWFTNEIGDLIATEALTIRLGNRYAPRCDDEGSHIAPHSMLVANGRITQFYNDRVSSLVMGMPTSGNGFRSSLVSSAFVDYLPRPQLQFIEVVPGDECLDDFINSNDELLVIEDLSETVSQDYSYSEIRVPIKQALYKKSNSPQFDQVSCSGFIVIDINEFFKNKIFLLNDRDLVDTNIVPWAYARDVRMRF